MTGYFLYFTATVRTGLYQRKHLAREEVLAPGARQSSFGETKLHHRKGACSVVTQP